MYTISSRRLLRIERISAKHWSVTSSTDLLLDMAKTGIFVVILQLAVLVLIANIHDIAAQNDTTAASNNTTTAASNMTISQKSLAITTFPRGIICALLLSVFFAIMEWVCTF